MNRADLEVIRRRCHRTQWFSPDAERDREVLLEYVDRLLKVVDAADAWLDRNDLLSAATESNRDRHIVATCDAREKFRAARKALEVP